MPYCTACGNQVEDTANFCPHCGSPHALPGPQPTADAANAPVGREKTFALIEKAGGPSLPRLHELSFRERMRVINNWWALLFGPLYYLAKGMWKKAITRFFMAYAIVSIFIWIVEAIGVSPGRHFGFVGSLLFSYMANTDYYRKAVLGDNGWL